MAFLLLWLLVVLFFTIGLVGVFVPMLPGSFLGAIYEGNSPDKASRAAVFSILGLLGAKILQLLLAIGIIVAFLIILFVN